MSKNLLIGLAKYGLGIGLLAYVVLANWSPSPDGSSPGLKGVLQRPIQLVPLALAILICLVSVLLTFFRWYLLVRAQELPFTLGNSLRLGLIGYFVSNFLPGSVTGDAVKAYFIARGQSRRTVAVATVLVDRAVGLWALFWFVAILGGLFWLSGVITTPEMGTFVLCALGLAGFTTLCWIILVLVPPALAERLTGRLQRLPRVGGAAAEFWRAIWMYRCQNRWIIATLLLSCVSHSGFVLAFYFAAHTFYDPSLPLAIPSLPEHFLIVPGGLTFQALFPAPGGLGGTEFAFGQLYYLALDTEAARTTGIVASLTMRMINWALGIAGYLIYLRMRDTMTELVQEPGVSEGPVPQADAGSNGPFQETRGSEVVPGAGAAPAASRTEPGPG